LKCLDGIALAAGQAFDSLGSLRRQRLDLSMGHLNSQCDIIVWNLGFFEVYQDFQSRKRNAFGSIGGWNALRVIPSPIKPRALAA
jgi:hypothetical protein